MAPERTDEAVANRTRRPGSTLVALRSLAARLLYLVCAVSATILALGALLVVLRDGGSEQSSVVALITDVADALAGPLRRTDGIDSFVGETTASKSALLNWGIAAVLYLVLGRCLAYLIAPRRSR